MTERAAETAGVRQAEQLKHAGEGAYLLSPPVLLVGLALALGITVICAAAIGAYAIPPLEVLGSVLHRAGLDVLPRAQGLDEEVLWQIRFPRVALAVIVGASLGCAGATMQGTFSNPLAEPGVVGVSSGAVLGAVGQIVLGFSLAGVWTITIAAFCGGLLTVLLVYLSARADGRTEVITLILTGIAVNAFAGALIGLMTFFSEDAELRSITFWTLGSMAQATWAKVMVVAPLAVIGVTVACLFARQLDLLSLGERSAQHLGVNVEQLRMTALLMVAVLTAAAVAVSGIILFIGLVIPHLVRMVAGPRHSVLMPATVLGGATILVLSDLAARTLAAPAELPLGVLTSLVGSPVFFWLLRRERAKQGGWA